MHINFVRACSVSKLSPALLDQLAKNSREKLFKIIFFLKPGGAETFSNDNFKYATFRMGGTLSLLSYFVIHVGTENGRFEF